MAKKTDEYFEVETIDTGPTYFLEEDIYVPEELVKNKSLIRMDMNIVQFPIFSKNTKRKKNEITTYFFNKNRDTYITVKPSAGELIPGEAEEKIFIALMKLLKEKNMAQEFVVTANEIRDAAKIHASHYIKEIKRALSRLSDTSYVFKNTMYSNELGGILNQEVNTPILTFKALSLKREENRKIKNDIKDNRIKEVFCIKISDHFYQNIVKRGYLVYDSDILLDIQSSIARTLYMLLEKIRFEELYVRESIYALIKKIPLKYEKNTLPITVKTIEKSLNELKEKKLIKDFNFLKPTTWLEADIEVFFDEVHNISKKERFAEDNKEVKNIYNNLAITHTEKNIEENLEYFKVTDEMVADILNLMPTKAKSLKSLPKTVRDAIEKYGYNRVKSATLYMKLQKKLTSPRAYFLKTLENEWDKGVIVDLEKSAQVQIKAENETLNFEEIKEEIQTFELQEEYFNKLSEREQLELEEEVYKDYINQCGQETKVQKIAFKAARKNLIFKYILNNNLIQLSGCPTTESQKIEESHFSEKNEVEVDVLNNIKAFNEYINGSIEMYKLGFDLTSEEASKIKKEIFLELTSKFMLRKLTMEELDETIKRKLS
ncbi:MAG: RepB family plasmid replication initiator protein [Cetobacterium sp.]|uniref:RepB family plasmid replication initiator protein n=1 Tax=Cetobacterium sp. TaxID=2071632 RepID=UPI003F2BF5AF